MENKLKTRTVVADIETDGLEFVTKIWCIVCKDVNSHEVFSFSGLTLASEFVAFSKTVHTWIGHNFISFDGRWITRLLGIPFSDQCVLDTLVLSRMLRYDLEGGHSLDAWGKRLGYPKVEHNEWNHFSPEMLHRCKEDVELNHRVYNYIMKSLGKPNFQEAIKVEMQSQWIARDMHENGFKFNFAEALKLYKELKGQLDEIDKEVHRAFPPRTALIRVITPSLTSKGTLHRKDFKWYDGNDYTQFSEGCPFSLFEWQPFNPGSPKQIVDRLWEAGWQPTDKTKGHILNDKDKGSDKESTEKFDRYGWSINEHNLSTLPDSAPLGAKLLVKRIIIAARIRTLDEWFQAYNPETGRIHGTFDPLGTRTQRCSHSKPNLGNIATAKTIKYNSPELRELAIDLGSRMRSLWICEEGTWLVGTDMLSAHLRIFGHLIDDKEYIQSLLTGSKDDGTDPHSINKHKLGSACVDRDRAKTFIFSFINGAGGNKVAQIFGCDKATATASIERFVQAYPGLARLRQERIPADARRRYFEGVDGRYVFNDSEHHMIGFYLQNAESVLMKHVNVLWRYIADKEGLQYKQVNWCHDEVVTEVKGSKENADRVGKIQAWSISYVGRKYKLNCPMSGEYKVGRNWLEVH